MSRRPDIIYFAHELVSEIKLWDRNETINNFYEILFKCYKMGYEDGKEE